MAFRFGGWFHLQKMTRLDLLPFSFRRLMGSYAGIIFKHNVALAQSVKRHYRKAKVMSSIFMGGS